MTPPDRIIAWGDKTTLGIVYKAGPCPMDGMALFPPAKYVRADLTEAQVAALVRACEGLFTLLDAGSLYEPQAFAARAAIASAKATL